MKSRMIWIIIWMTAVAGKSTPAQAASRGIRIGNSLLHLFAEQNVTFDGNVDESADGPTDMYTQRSIGALWSSNTDTLSLQSSAWLSEQRYEQFTENNSRSWECAGTAQLFSDKSKLTLQGRFLKQDDTDDAASYSSDTSTITEQTDVTFDQTNSSKARSSQTMQVDFLHQISDITSLRTTYGFYQVDYEQMTLDGWYNQSVGSEISQNITSKLAVYTDGQLNIQGGNGAPENGRGYSTHVGFSNLATQKTLFKLGLGFEYYTSKSEQYTEPSVELSAGWLATDKLSFFAICRDSFQPVGTDNLMQWVVYGSLGTAYQISPTTSLTLFGTALRQTYLDEILIDSQPTRPVVVEMTETAQLNYSPET